MFCLHSYEVIGWRGICALTWFGWTQQQVIDKLTGGELYVAIKRDRLRGGTTLAARLRLIEQVATVCEQRHNGAVTNDTSATSWPGHHDMRVLFLLGRDRRLSRRCCRPRRHRRRRRRYHRYRRGRCHPQPNTKKSLINNRK